MANELETITVVSNSTQLASKLEEVEEGKTEVETLVQERASLLHETTEEWEQCERKMRDVRAWLERSARSIDPGKQTKPLRDRLAIREKLVADAQIQRTKLSISVEKLMVGMIIKNNIFT